MNFEWKLNIETGQVGGTASSLLAELVKLVGIWAKIQELLTETPTRSESRQVEKLNEIDRLLDFIESCTKLSVNELHSKAEFYEEPPELLTSTTKLRTTVEIAQCNDEQSVSLPTFPWEYISFMSHGEPVDDAGNDITSRSVLSQQENPSQSRATIERDDPQSLDSRHQFTDFESPITGSNEADLFPTEW
ncbi:hypothetical protein N0V90_011940 [Kalmusia sp. IMI 367209]|nr:hypothetical protein N0V90_011940 [Kalmusia sp. IMI 367209]